VNMVILVAASDIPSNDVDTSALPNYGPEVARPDETAKPSAAADDKKSDRKSTVSATAELLCGVRDSVGAFGPLRSVARSLCFILGSCEVRPPSFPHVRSIFLRSF